jgi:predicted SAM-dependent methyltransferase
VIKILLYSFFMKLHLGCGKRYLDGYINIDIIGNCDIFADLRKLPYEDCSVDEIYASHVLEHFGRHETEGVLSEWARVLKPAGSLYVAVPDFDSTISYYIKTRDIGVITGLLWGGQKDQYDYHKMGFTFSSLKQILENMGFGEIGRYDTFSYLPEGFDDYSKCFLPHMDFSGTHVSLNLRAVKNHL